MYYYMITVYIDEQTKEKNYRPFINPYSYLKQAQNAVDWQKQGGFEEENIICKRVDSLNFKRIDTEEVITIDGDNRQPYTVEAWEEFINREY